MEFKLHFNMDNAAFNASLEGDIDEEVMAILDQVVSEVNQGKIQYIITDSNGNKIGEWRIE